MKKYHIADVLTALEFVCAVVLLILTIMGADPGIALVVFLFGELCDAFDGIAARTWHYPDDGKVRWWREHANGIDQLSDIVLAFVVLVYVAVHVDFALGVTIIILALVVGWSVQFWVYGYLQKHSPDLALKVVLARRFMYLAGIVVVTVKLMIAASWTRPVKYILMGLCLVASILLWFLKEDRRTQDKTPL
ncbi:CDP-alcohol phosphatidyltransferase family protein [Candidatus Saccharibacteria bacterium]|nr:CDP-alcohol phosphatidyltransferase family protein [Candidatus Saccharibacteria bacterium]